MTVLKPRVVVDGLLNKGFRVRESGDRYLILYVNGIKQHIWTKVSHSSRKECEEWHIHKMAKQVKLTKSQFIDLIHCPLKSEQYLEILSNQGIRFSE